MATPGGEVPAASRTGPEAVKDEDVALIVRAQGGDLDAFRQSVERFSPRIHAIAYQIAGNAADAQDIAQEVFMKLFRCLGQYDPKFLFTTWLYRLTVNVSIDYRRKNARHTRTRTVSRERASNYRDPRPRPDACAEQNELRGAIRQITRNLTMMQRKVFVLRELQGFTATEVATILQCSPNTVRVHLARARNRIKEALVKHYPHYMTRNP